MASPLLEASEAVVVVVAEAEAETSELPAAAVASRLVPPEVVVVVSEVVATAVVAAATVVVVATEVASHPLPAAAVPAGGKLCFTAVVSRLPPKSPFARLPSIQSSNWRRLASSTRLSRSRSFRFSFR